MVLPSVGLYPSTGLYPGVTLLTPGYMMPEYNVAYYNNDLYFPHYGLVIQPVILYLNSYIHTQVDLSSFITTQIDLVSIVTTQVELSSHLA